MRRAIQLFTQKIIIKDNNCRVSQARLPLQSPSQMSSSSQRNSISTQGALSKQASPMQAPAINALLYCTDIDAVDVATRVAMVNVVVLDYNALRV